MADILVVQNISPNGIEIDKTKYIVLVQLA